MTGLPRTIPDAVAAAGAAWPEREAVIDGDRRVTFADLATMVAHGTGAIADLGIANGDRVAIWAPNSLDWIVACVAIQAAGGITVPINSRLKGAEAAFILNATRAVALLTVTGFAGNDYPALIADELLPHLRDRLLLDGNGPADWGARMARATPQASRARPGDVADIIFTSGTTGAPKGVTASHAQNVATADGWATPVGLREGDRYLLVNPFFHCFGYKAGWLPCLLRGAAAIAVASFDAAGLPRLIEDERITLLAGAPTIFQSLIDAPAAIGGVGTLCTVVTGAASVPPVLIERLRGDLGVPNVLTGYGLTEATGVVTMSCATDSVEVVATTAGRPVPGVEVVCVDAAGLPVAQGREGEVRVRGYNVMAGYFEDPEGTAAAIDAEGWLHTGDVGRFTSEGCLQITDRLKDMYISGGFNCYPAEIERLLAAHPAIAHAAVIGVADMRMGEVGKAFVVLRPHHAAEPDEIVSWARAAMANYKAPRFVEIVGALPVNPSGKVQKHLLRERHGAVSRESA